MFKICGLIHISLIAKDFRRPVDFCRSVFRMEPKAWTDPDMVFLLKTPRSDNAGTSGRSLRWRMKTAARILILTALVLFLGAASVFSQVRTSTISLDDLNEMKSGYTRHRHRSNRC